jgi:hypothetical protein
MNPKLTAEQSAQLDGLLYQRRKIEAIKQYRLWTGGELVDAKQAMDARTEELQRLNPSGFAPAKAGCAAVLLACLGLAVAVGAGLAFTMA